MKECVLYVSPDKIKKADYDAVAAEGYELIHADKLSDVLEICDNSPPTIMLVDSSFKEMPVLQLLPVIFRKLNSVQVVCVVASNQSDLVSQSIEKGAVDYLIKPFLSSQLQTCIRNVTSLLKGAEDIVAVSHASRSVLQMANRVAFTNASVLILGESGTGKERLARFIHKASDRKDSAFIAVNCAAIPENMLEGILFGHNKGAFTGAISHQIGKFEAANGGTLLLDEISELPLSLQAKLLRVLQEKEVERLGSNSPIKLDVRIIAASNKNLYSLVQEGKFREDLYYRLEVLPLKLPALRERREDILPLSQFFISKYGQNNFTLSESASNILFQYNWPGNVRELENVIQRAIVMARGREIQAGDLDLPVKLTPAHEIMAGYCAQTLKQNKQDAEYDYIIELLKKFNGRRTDTAKALGMSTRALRYKLAAMREQGIDVSCL